MLRATSGSSRNNPRGEIDSTTTELGASTVLTSKTKGEDSGVLTWVNPQVGTRPPISTVIPLPPKGVTLAPQMWQPPHSTSPTPTYRFKLAAGGG